MKYHISEADSAIVLELRNELISYLGAKGLLDIDFLLARTDYDKANTLSEGYSYLWDSCTIAIRKIFQTKNLRRTEIIVRRCLQFEGFTRNERDILSKLLEICDEISKAQTESETIRSSYEFFMTLDWCSEAYDFLAALLASPKQKEIEIEIRTLLDECMRYLKFSGDEEFNNISALAKLSPHDPDIFGLLVQRDTSNDEVFNLIIEELRNNAENETFWEQLVTAPLPESIYFKIADTFGFSSLTYVPLMKEIILNHLILGTPKIAIGLLESIRNKAYWDQEFASLLIKSYIGDTDYHSAEQLIDKLLLKEPDCKELLFQKAYILETTKHFKKAISYYDKIVDEYIEGVNIRDRLFVCHSALGHERKAKLLFEQFCGNDIARRSFRQIYSWVDSDLIPEKFLYECLNNRKTERHRPNTYWNEFDYFFYQVFSDTQGISDNGLLRVRLLKLYRCIKKIKQNLQIRPEAGTVVYHYAPIHTIIPLTRYQYESEKVPKFHVSNVAHVNDPSEGIVFLNILEAQCGGTKVKETIEQIYGSENLYYRRTYLSSFSKKSDFLPMWVQYAENGAGCCYGLSTLCFGYQDYSLERQVIVDAEYINKRFFERPPLYEVFYYDDSGEAEKAETIYKICKEIGELIISLAKYLTNNRVKLAIAGMLDEIRYLFKSADYSTESEVRVVMTDFDKSAKVFLPSGNDKAPKLYLELNTDLIFEELMLGPKVRNVKEWAAYLGNCTNVRSISKSKIQYE